MRLVLDTNTLVSGLVWHGTPGKLIDAARQGHVSLATTVPLLAELRGVLPREKFARELVLRSVTAEGLFDGYAAIAVLVAPVPIPLTVTRDPEDDRVLECALGARADLVVSGDDHLLSLGTFRGIPIVKAAEALGRITTA